MVQLLDAIIPKFLKRKGDVQSKYVLRIAKDIIANLDINYIDLNTILFIRSDIQNFSEELEIYRLPRELIIGLKMYYVVSIQPSFDLLYEHDQYKKVYHILKHIPKSYLLNPDLEPHDIEAFSEEYKFDKGDYSREGYYFEDGSIKLSSSRFPKSSSPVIFTTYFEFFVAKSLF